MQIGSYYSGFFQVRSKQRQQFGMPLAYFGVRSRDVKPMPQPRDGSVHNTGSQLTVLERLVQRISNLLDLIPPQDPINFDAWSKRRRAKEV